MLLRRAGPRAITIQNRIKSSVLRGNQIVVFLNPPKKIQGKLIEYKKQQQPQKEQEQLQRRVGLQQQAMLMANTQPTNINEQFELGKKIISQNPNIPKRQQILMQKQLERAQMKEAKTGEMSKQFEQMKQMMETPQMQQQFEQMRQMMETPQMQQQFEQMRQMMETPQMQQQFEQMRQMMDSPQMQQNFANMREQLNTLPNNNPQTEEQKRQRVEQLQAQLTGQQTVFQKQMSTQPSYTTQTQTYTTTFQQQQPQQQQQQQTNYSFQSNPPDYTTDLPNYTTSYEQPKQTNYSFQSNPPDYTSQPPDYTNSYQQQSFQQPQQFQQQPPDYSTQSQQNTLSDKNIDPQVDLFMKFQTKLQLIIANGSGLMTSSSKTYFKVFLISEDSTEPEFIIQTDKFKSMKDPSWDLETLVTIPGDFTDEIFQFEVMKAKSFGKDQLLGAFQIALKTDVKNKTYKSFFAKNPDSFVYNPRVLNAWRKSKTNQIFIRLNPVKNNLSSLFQAHHKLKNENQSENQNQFKSIGLFELHKQLKQENQFGNGGNNSSKNQILKLKLEQLRKAREKEVLEKKNQSNSNQFGNDEKDSPKRKSFKNKLKELRNIKKQQLLERKNQSNPNQFENGEQVPKRKSFKNKLKELRNIKKQELLERKNQSNSNQFGNDEKDSPKRKSFKNKLKELRNIKKQELLERKNQSNSNQFENGEQVPKRKSFKNKLKELRKAREKEVLEKENQNPKKYDGNENKETFQFENQLDSHNLQNFGLDPNITSNDLNQYPIGPISLEQTLEQQNQQSLQQEITYTSNSQNYINDFQGYMNTFDQPKQTSYLNQSINSQNHSFHQPTNLNSPQKDNRSIESQNQIFQYDLVNSSSLFEQTQQNIFQQESPSLFSDSLSLFQNTEEKTNITQPTFTFDESFGVRTETIMNLLIIFDKDLMDIRQNTQFKFSLVSQITGQKGFLINSKKFKQFKESNLDLSVEISIPGDFIDEILSITFIGFMDITFQEELGEIQIPLKTETKNIQIEREFTISRSKVICKWITETKEIPILLDFEMV
ncbi:mediator of RNA polymerase ii transcription subunit 12 [Anaeramoeba ignava]|uniref:Mediator of RNA polymerase ii transcription subunit 12 n=1 Tax=Anaeramoeba ignava TaxID=1746090 RepID=A0A9Q0R9R0_ANAIG|nr:mediator of RNA polymerase ii transcription subunit 12 [Anaeramoeba ignava]